MSMISEQVKLIRAYEKDYRSGETLGRMIQGTEDVLKNAADTIEELSKKLASANMEKSEQHYDNDYVKVIRCKDCKQWGVYKVLGETERIKCRGYGYYFVAENGYCVYGDKKDG